MPIVSVSDAADPRLDDYRRLREKDLRREGDRFIAESELVVRKLLASGWPVLSVLLSEARLAAFAALSGSEALRPEVLTYVAPQAVLDAVAGFHVHRGCLAVGVRPFSTDLPSAAKTVLVLEDLVDVDNVGALVRNAAALGADALVLSPRCADPFYRKAIRVSMGNVFHVPIVRVAESAWPAFLRELRVDRGFTLVGAVLDERAVALPVFRRPERLALLLGAEGPGLTVAAKSFCDTLVTIPMARADSLNVATAGAVLLYAAMT